MLLYRLAMRRLPFFQTSLLNGRERNGGEGENGVENNLFCEVYIREVVANNMAVAIQPWHFGTDCLLLLSLHCGSVAGSGIVCGIRSAPCYPWIQMLDRDRETGVYAMYTHSHTLYGITDTPFLLPKVHRE